VFLFVAVARLRASAEFKKVHNSKRTLSAESAFELLDTSPEFVIASRYENPRQPTGKKTNEVSDDPYLTIYSDSCGRHFAFFDFVCRPMEPRQIPLLT